VISTLLISPPKVIYAELHILCQGYSTFFQTYFRITLYTHLKKKRIRDRDRKIVRLFVERPISCWLKNLDLNFYISSILYFNFFSSIFAFKIRFLCCKLKFQVEF
jgi:hypothetical protein